MIAPKEIVYPNKHYLAELKNEILENKEACVDIKARFGKTMLLNAIDEFINGKGLSFRSVLIFLWYVKLFYSILVLDMKGYTIALMVNNKLKYATLLINRTDGVSR